MRFGPCFGTMWALGSYPRRPPKRGKTSSQAKDGVCVVSPLAAAESGGGASMVLWWWCWRLTVVPSAVSFQKVGHPAIDVDSPHVLITRGMVGLQEGYFPI